MHKSPCAKRFEIDDNRASQILLMLSEKRPHTAVPRELGTQRHEPHLGVDVGIAELVDVLDLLGHALLIAFRSSSGLFGYALGIKLGSLHTPRRECASIP